MVDYPIPPPYQELLISVDMIIVFIVLEISLYFFYKYWKNKKNRMPSVVELDWGIIFGIFGIAFASFLYGDNFAPESRSIFIMIGYLSLNIGAILFFYHIESSKLRKHKFIYTPFFTSVLFILIILYIFWPSILQFIAGTFFLIAYIVIIGYFLTIVKRIYAIYKFNSVGLLLGIVFWLAGFSGNSDIAIDLFNGFYIRVIGDILIITGMILVGFFLNSIPTLAELGWQKKLKYIIMTTPGGVGLFIENFQERKPIDELLIAGALSGINIFMDTMMKDPGKIRVISRGQEKFLLHEGKYTIGILVVEEELEILKYLLKEFVRQFEDFYKPILENWTGSVEIFNSSRFLVDHIFRSENLS